MLEKTFVETWFTLTNHAHAGVKCMAAEIQVVSENGIAINENLCATGITGFSGLPFFLAYRYSPLVGFARFVSAASCLGSWKILTKSVGAAEKHF
jgi:hypothetical protein